MTNIIVEYKHKQIFQYTKKGICDKPKVKVEMFRFRNV